MAKDTKAAPSKKKKAIKISEGILHLYTSPNNSIVTLTDLNGNKVSGGGAGMVGFKGAKENTPYAAEVLTKKILKDAKDNGLKEIGIVIRGMGMGRDGVFKAVNEIGLIDIKYIKDETSLKHGGTKGIRPKRA